MCLILCPQVAEHSQQPHAWRRIKKSSEWRTLDVWWVLTWHAAHAGAAAPGKDVRAFQAAYATAPMHEAALRRALHGHEATLQVRAPVVLHS